MLTEMHQNDNNDRKQKYNIDGTERTCLQRKTTTNLTPRAKMLTIVSANIGGCHVAG